MDQRADRGRLRCTTSVIFSRTCLKVLDRLRFEIIGDGQGVHWPDIDEDISAEGMLHGVPARRPKPSA
ncbi:MAG: DUF2442 domain-containing protein [Candidatus Latescibacteria bacterium]|nr:DUF2442 domain-containing protein [Candidatus Latescibacterota bacterium]